MKNDVYLKQTVEQLLEQCQKRIPRFVIDFNVFQAGMGVMARWRCDFRSPMSAWQRKNPSEMSQGGSYRSMKDTLVAVLERVDRFDAWTAEQKMKALAVNSVRIRVLAERVANRTGQVLEPIVDEGEEEVPAQELDPIVELSEDPSQSVEDPQNNEGPDFGPSRRSRYFW